MLKNSLIPFVLVLLLLPLTSVATQDTVQKRVDDKKALKMLLKERRDRFSQYTERIDDKSGFFGNQTKKDLREINEVLKEIVRTDNKIIAELDRLLDERKFESFRSEYETKRAGEDLVMLEQQNRKLMAQNDTLVKQVEALRAGGRTAGGGTSNTPVIYVFLTWFFGAILLFILLLRYRKSAAK